MKKNFKNSIEFIYKKAGRNLYFSFPPNYFEDLDNAIFSKITTSKLSKKTGFKTPKNYFSDVENKILEKISKEQHQPKVINFKRRIIKLIPYLVAASIALFITFNSLIYREKKSITFDSLSKNDIELWFDSNTLNSSDIVTVIGEDFLEMNDFSFSKFKNENLENYLYNIDNQLFLDEKD